MWCVAAVGCLMAQVGDGFVAPNRPAVNPMTGEPMNVKVANLAQDTEATRKDVSALTLRVEQLEREKAALETKVSAGTDTVTRDEMKLMEARMTTAMNDAVKAEGQRVQKEILEEIRNAKKAVKTEAPAPAANFATNTAAPVTVTEKIVVSDAEKQSYMKEGIRYTVQQGDTLTSIAKKHKSTVRAIMVVNEIASPNKLFVGKELFVPTLEK